MKKTFIRGNKPLLVASIMGTTKNEILESVKKLKETEIDWCEWRVDAYEDVNNIECLSEVLYSIKELIKVPILFTLRTKAEGGMFLGSEEEYLAICRSVLEEKTIDLIDIEWQIYQTHSLNWIQYFNKEPIQFVLSIHDFYLTPSHEGIEEIGKKMASMNPHFIKLAYMPQRIEDTVSLFKATLVLYNMVDCNLISISMGAIGQVSRMIGYQFGSCATYVSAELSSAPGQLSFETTSEFLNQLFP